MTNIIDRHIGKRLRLRRQTLGIDRETLALHLGVPVQTLADMETGKTRIRVDILLQLATLLSVELRHFFEGPHDFDAEEAYAQLLKAHPCGEESEDPGDE